MGVFSVCEILEYLNHEQKVVKGKESYRTLKEQKRESIYVVDLAFLGVRPDIALCVLVGAPPLSVIASPRNIFLITYWRNILYPEDNKET